jgi:O-antigen ligase
MPSESKFIALIIIALLLVLNLSNKYIKLIVLSIFIILGLYIATNCLHDIRFVNLSDDMTGKYKYLIDYQRYLVYSSVWNDFNSTNPLLGLGIGDMQSRLKEIIPISQWALDFDNKPELLNTHNQYLDILYSRGWVGLISFLALVLSLIMAIGCKWRNYSALVFFMLIIFLMNFENVLNRAWGNYIVYFSLLYFSIVYKSNPNVETH